MFNPTTPVKVAICLLVTFLLVRDSSAEVASWTTDETVGVSEADLTIEIGCTGDPITCLLLDGYESQRAPALTGSGVALVSEGGTFELLLDKSLVVPPLQAWVVDAEPVMFDPIPLVGTPTVTNGALFGTEGGPFAVPGLTFSPFGPVMISETIRVGLRYDLSGLGDPQPDQVAGPAPELFNGMFEMIDRTRFEVRDFVWTFSDTACSGPDPEDPCSGPGLVIAVTISGLVRLNLSGEIMLQLDVDRTQLDWTALGGVLGYDVVRGDLGTLRATAGDFTAAIAECIEDDFAAPPLAYFADPPSGAGHFFLVRWVGPGPSNATYDVPFASQQGSRDAEIDIAPGACP